ncbi:MAG TPA: phage holin family protein [Phycisphaerales bacterium]|nr:phage holin family protein [Phycisphaerales bacterium]
MQRVHDNDVGRTTSRLDDDRSVADLFRELAHESGALVRQEVELAKAEVQEKLTALARRSVLVVVGAVVGLLGAIALTAALGWGLASLLINAGLAADIAMWLAPLIVGLVLAGAGAALVMRGVAAIRNMSLVPRKTAEDLQETTRWMKDKIV